MRHSTSDGGPPAGSSLALLLAGLCSGFLTTACGGSQATTPCHAKAFAHAVERYTEECEETGVTGCPKEAEIEAEQKAAQEACK